MRRGIARGHGRGKVGGRVHFACARAHRIRGKCSPIGGWQIPVGKQRRTAADCEGGPNRAKGFAITSQRSDATGERGGVGLSRGLGAEYSQFVEVRAFGGLPALTPNIPERRRSASLFPRS